MPSNRAPYFKKRYEECKRKGVCYTCGNKLPSGYDFSKKPHCEKCKEQNDKSTKAYKTRNVKAGMCKTCGQNKIVRAKLCESCHQTQIHAQHDYGLRLKVQVLTHYADGHKPECTCCGEGDMTLLNLDHLEGGGNVHRREVGFGPAFYRWVIKQNFPKGFQVLCYNCNIGKHRNGGVCPSADAHLHLKFVRKMYPLHKDADRMVLDNGVVVFRVPYRVPVAGNYGIPAAMNPLIVKVQHDVRPKLGDVFAKEYLCEFPQVPPPRRDLTQKELLEQRKKTHYSYKLKSGETVLIPPDLLQRYLGNPVMFRIFPQRVEREAPGLFQFLNNDDPGFYKAYQETAGFFLDVKRVIAPETLHPDELKPFVVNIKDVPGVPVSRDIPGSTLDATGMQAGETRTGKVSFETRQVKPGGDV